MVMLPAQMLLPVEPCSAPRFAMRMSLPIVPPPSALRVIDSPVTVVPASASTALGATVVTPVVSPSALECATRRTPALTSVSPVCRFATLAVKMFAPVFSSLPAPFKPLASPPSADCPGASLRETASVASAATVTAPAPAVPVAPPVAICNVPSLTVVVPA